MEALFGFSVGLITSWIAFRMLRWEKEEELKNVEEDKDPE